MIPFCLETNGNTNCTNCDHFSGYINDGSGGCIKLKNCIKAYPNVASEISYNA